MAFRLFSREEKSSPPPERKASATGRVVAFASGSGRPVWSARDTGTLTRGGFMGNPVGFRSVRLIAEAEDVTKPSVASSQDTRKVLQFILANYIHQLNTVHHQEENLDKHLHIPQIKKKETQHDKMPEVRPNPHLLHHQPTN